MSSIPFYAKRFVAGVNADQALKVAKHLNDQGISASLDLLGENIRTAQEAHAACESYLELLASMEQQNCMGHLSVKLTLLGLDVDSQLCRERLEALLHRADAKGRRVALDMEGSAYTERTLKIYEDMCKRFRSPEAVIQAYLKRTPEDLQRVLKANGRLRLCKGAYKESASVAFKNMEDIRSQYKQYLDILLKDSDFVAIATHDDALIGHAKERIDQWGIPKKRYEFQMLYGLRKKTWAHMVADQRSMCVYLPYGLHWQAYFSRRLAERKENVLFVLRNLFRS